MISLNHSRPILWLSLINALLISFASCVGLSVTDFYGRESANWQAQSIGQDIADLFLIVPCLLVTAFLSYKDYRFAKILWGGVVLYLVYTFLIYCFAVHFNNLFIIYCLILGLSFYSFIFFLSEQSKKAIVPGVDKPILIKVVGIYFLVIPVFFYFLWLSEIIPAIIKNGLPESIAGTSLLTNPVEVIDLSIFLPGLIITGILILKRRPIGLLLAPVFLAFFVLMDITIGFLAVVMKNRGIESNLSITIAMTLLALFSLFVLIWYLRNIKKLS